VKLYAYSIGYYLHPHPDNKSASGELQAPLGNKMQTQQEVPPNLGAT